MYSLSRIDYHIALFISLILNKNALRAYMLTLPSYTENRPCYFLFVTYFFAIPPPSATARLLVSIENAPTLHPLLVATRAIPISYLLNLILRCASNLLHGTCQTQSWLLRLVRRNHACVTLFLHATCHRVLFVHIIDLSVCISKRHRSFHVPVDRSVLPPHRLLI